MHTKGDAELNRGGAGDPHALCDSDLCATSAPGDGEKQNPPTSPVFPVNPHQTTSIPTVFFFI